MSPWWWVLIYGAIAVGAGVVFGVIGLRVWRKARVLIDDLAAFSETAGRLEVAVAPLAEWAGQEDHVGRHSPSRHDYLP